MAINLTKGETVNLTQQVDGLNNVLVGVGWDLDSDAWDLDLMAISIDANDKPVQGDDSLLFFNSTKQADGSLVGFDPALVHSGDNRTGAGDGDDESIRVDLQRVNASTDKIVFIVGIFEADSPDKNFGHVRNAFIRIVDEATREEIVRYDLGEDFYRETAVRFGQLYRYNGEWKFRALGEGHPDGTIGILRSHGLNV